MNTLSCIAFLPALSYVIKYFILELFVEAQLGPRVVRLLHTIHVNGTSVIIIQP